MALFCEWWKQGLKQQVLKKIYFLLVRMLPEKLVDRLRISRVGGKFRRWKNKKKAELLKAKKLAAIKTHGEFEIEELFQRLRNLNINDGDVLFVQTSFNDLYTLKATPPELLQMLLRLVGTEGTLLMPAYSSPRQDANWIFDVSREPTYTGIVNEIFRRSPTVMRSLHPRHSICGKGVQAMRLLRDHESCLHADGLDSPFDRLRSCENAKILTLGLPKGYTSFLHWIEDIEPKKLPFPIHEKQPVKYTVRSKDKTVEISDYQVDASVAANLCLQNISDKLSDRAMVYECYKNIGIGIYPVKALSQELIELRDRGIIHYR